MAKRLWFGPAGKPLTMKGSRIEKAPEYLRSIGLDAMEYEAVRGVRISERKARLLGSEAEKHGVVMSLHAPYYINLASPEPEKREASIRRVVESLKAAEWMGAYVVVVHTGYYKGYRDRKEALKVAIEGYRRALEEAPGWVRRPSVSPELMGRKAAIGDVDEIIEICRELGSRCRPTVDWAHLYARYEGSRVLSVDDVIGVVELIERELGSQAVRPLHTHFSKIEYGRGGEREHHTLSEEGYGPEWSIVCQAYLETGIQAVVISESPVLEKDAIVMRDECRERAPDAV